MLMNKILPFILMGSVFLAGCDQSTSYQGNTSQPLPFEVAKHEAPLSDEQVELQNMLKEMQAKDPSIVDAYYSVNENGEKYLTVVQEDPNATTESGGSGLSTFMWAMAGGLAANALFNAFSSGGMKGMVNSHKPSANSVISRSQYLTDKSLSSRRYSSFNNSSVAGNSLNRTATPQPVQKAVTRPSAPSTATANSMTAQKAKPVTVVKKRPSIKPRKKTFKSFGFGKRRH